MRRYVQFPKRFLVGRPQTRTTLKNCQQAIGGRVEHSLIEALGVAVGEFEFETASMKLEQIARELNMNGGQAHS